jgi:methionyl aminopeptidase
MGFPSTICASINEEVVHGIPSRARVLNEGDVVSIDLGVYKGGYHGDAAVTVPVGRVKLDVKRLLEVTEESLECGIAQMIPGNRLHDISAAVQRHAEEHGYSIVREYVGHGIGREMHEPPQIPNYVPAGGPNPVLKPGYVMAIEPMVNLGRHQVKVLSDKWTVVTKDGKVSAHFEHTVAITESGNRVLTKLS